MIPDDDGAGGCWVWAKLHWEIEWYDDVEITQSKRDLRISAAHFHYSVIETYWTPLTVVQLTSTANLKHDFGCFY